MVSMRDTEDTRQSWARYTFTMVDIAQVILELSGPFRFERAAWIDSIWEVHTVPPCAVVCQTFDRKFSSSFHILSSVLVWVGVCLASPWYGCQPLRQIR